MTSPILVTGGTGTLGRLVVRRLREAGCNVRVLSRRSHEAEDGIQFVTGDLARGEGIEAAVEGTEIIVHCAGGPKGDEDKARNLVRAASRAGEPHLVYISVVGADRIPVSSGIDRAMFGYFASKLAAERVVADSGLAVDHVARRPVPRPDPDGGGADVQAACDTTPGRVPIPAGRYRRGGGPAHRTSARYADRTGARHGRAADLQRGRAAPRIPAGYSPAPTDHSCLAAR